MSIVKMASYDLNGEKLSFADWISNLSPTETPFTSMTGKEAINQTKFQWQTDTIPKAKTVATAACEEGSKPTFDDPFSTHVITNNTQIFRRSVSVSDTANVVSYYGRQKEVGYQMEKAGLELKRDIEVALLSQVAGGSNDDPQTADAGGKVATMGKPGTSSTAPKTAGFVGLCLKKDAKDKDTDAVLHKETAANTGPTEAEIFDMTYNLYIANSKANVIMFHPKWAEIFTGLIEIDAAQAAPDKINNRMKMFKGMDDKYNAEVNTIIDPLGQKFALVPNRLMPEDHIYFFNPIDWTQMVLRAPKKIQLAKQGSSEEWMIECELGLRHRNPAASAVLKIKA